VLAHGWQDTQGWFQSLNGAIARIQRSDRAEPSYPRPNLRLRSWFGSRGPMMQKVHRVTVQATHPMAPLEEPRPPPSFPM
jgi:hypothetical protein